MSAVSSGLSDEFRRFIDFLNEAIVILSSDGIIIDANRAFCELYGYELAELSGRHYTMLSAEPHISQEAFRDALIYSQIDGPDSSMTCENRHTDS